MVSEARAAFEGLRVADFSWVGVGPTVAKYLADHGAEVIRIESATYPEALRRGGPFVDDTPGINNSGYFANFNSSKRGVSINLKHPEGVGLAKRLVAECDVVVESYTAGTMARLGLGYETLAEVRPDIVMMSLPLYGQDGPWSGYSGYGHTLQSAAGFNHLTGWPDGPPIGTGIAYTDFLVPHIATVALIAALDHRRRTGEGQYIDFSQLEGAVHGLWTTMLEWTANGRELARMGNRDPDAAPHGAYRCRDGTYIAIACFTEEHWTALKAALGRPDWCDLERMRRKWQRLNEQKEIDRHLSHWVEDMTRKASDPEQVEVEGQDGIFVRKYTPHELMKYLQSFGVPAGVIQSPEMMHADPQMAHRHHYWRLRHPAMGDRTYDSAAFKLSETPARLTKAAPLLGEDTEAVFTGLLGMPRDEFDRLRDDGAFE